MVKKIGRNEFRELICTNKNVRIVDVLDMDHFNQEHMRGAISLPLSSLEKRAEETLHKNDKIVVYCAGFKCPASTEAARKLMAMGFTDVLDYKGGIQDYKEAEFPLEGSLHKEEPTRSFPCEFATR